MTSTESFFDGPFEVESDKVNYTDDAIFATYSYQTTTVENRKGKTVVMPQTQNFEFKTDRKVPRVGAMFVGWGGNNGTTVTASIIANRHGIVWNKKEGEVRSNYFGSLTQSSTIRIGNNECGDNVYIPFKNLLPMVNPNDLVIGGWDICSTPLGDAMKNAKVLDYDLQRQVYEEMQKLRPLPSVYFPDFIAANQAGRATNVLKGSKQEQLDQIRKDIRDFKSANNLDKVIVLWTANTERFAEVRH